MELFTAGLFFGYLSCLFLFLLSPSKKKIFNNFNDTCWYVDVDDTLITWVGDTYVPCKDVILQIQRAHERNQTIVLWSAGGSEWARRVAEELKIDHMIYDAIAKPKWTMDDSRNPLENSIRVPFTNAKGERLE